MSELVKMSRGTTVIALDKELCIKLRETAERVAQDAGQLIIAEGYRANGPRGQDDKAAVDGEVERLIYDRLTEAFPTHGFTVEEKRSLNRRPREAEKLHWYIDPNDGTSAFLRGFRGSAISIGLLYGAEPIFGVVYAPTYPNDQGDFISGGYEEFFGPLTRNGVSIYRNRSKSIDPTTAVIAVSQDADSKTEQNLTCSLSMKYLAIPSIAYRLALVAVGDVSAGVSLAYPTDYDCAAGHALLRAVGYELYSDKNTPFSYSRSSSGVVIGGEPSLCHRLYALPWSRVKSGYKVQDRLPYGLSRPSWKKRVSRVDSYELSLGQGALLGMLKFGG